MPATLAEPPVLARTADDAASRPKLHLPVNVHTELRLLDRTHSEELFHSLQTNREHLRPWHPWVELFQTPADVEKAIILWRQQHALNRGFYAGIWHREKFCGMIGHLNLDWANRWTALTYWLDAAHQGRGIMTDCCRAVIGHAFNTWKLNRVTIESATENYRSRAIPERLGFKLEGIIRQIAWLHDHYADQALYGLLRADCTPGHPIHSALS